MAKFLGQVVEFQRETQMCITHTGERTVVILGEAKIGDYLFQNNGKVYVGGMSDIHSNEEALKRYKLFTGANNPTPNATNDELQKLGGMSEERKALEEEASALGIKVSKNMKDETIRKAIEAAKLKAMEGEDNEQDQEEDN